MPTGLTAPMYDGDEGFTFEDFVWRCARQMGALIMMRDDSMDAPIPEKFEAHVSYHDDALRNAEARLSEYGSMILEEATRRAENEFQATQDAREQANRSAIERRSRYEAMLAQVQEWDPPTTDHEGLKKLMTEQLEESIRFDCSMTGWPEYPKLSGAKWLREAIRKAKQDIEYHAEKRGEEIERTESRNEWIAALRRSVASAVSNTSDEGDAR